MRIGKETTLPGWGSLLIPGVMGTQVLMAGQFLDAGLLGTAIVVLVLLLPKILLIVRDWSAEKRIGEARATEAEALAELKTILVDSVEDKGDTKEALELLGHLQSGRASQAESDTWDEQVRGSEWWF